MFFQYDYQFWRTKSLQKNYKFTWILICNVYWHFENFIAFYIARYTRISHNLVDSDTCMCIHSLLLEPDWQTSGSAEEKLKMGLNTYWIACGTLTQSSFWFYLHFHIPKALDL